MGSAKKKYCKKTKLSAQGDMAKEQTMAPLQVSSHKQKTAQKHERENLVLLGIQSQPAKHGPNRKSLKPRTIKNTVLTEGKTIVREYYRPTEDTDIYRHAGNGILVCVTNPSNTIKVESDDKLPCSRESPIWRDPLTTRITSVEALRNLYLNSFDRLGSIEGEYEIKIDPSVPPVQNSRRKVPIEAKEEI